MSAYHDIRIARRINGVIWIVIVAVYSWGLLEIAKWWVR
jgi:hypothetical protein